MSLPEEISPIIPTGGRGPFVTALLSTIIAAGLLITFAAGMKMSLTTIFAVVVPASTVSVFFVAVSMGWCFVMFGRYNLRPFRLHTTMVLIGITMFEMLTVIIICSRAGSAYGGF
jgi:hypothetical protein